jgi:2-methylcitrate dehydratase
VLDSLGCALGALDGDPVKMIAEQNREFGGEPLSAQIAAGRTAPDRAALYNGALVRYLDLNDSYLAPAGPVTRATTWLRCWRPATTHKPMDGC